MNKEKRAYKWIIIVPIIIILSGLQAQFLSFLLKDIIEQSIIIFITVWVVCSLGNLLIASILNEHLRLYFSLKSINKEEVIKKMRKKNKIKSFCMSIPADWIVEEGNIKKIKIPEEIMKRIDALLEEV